VPSSFLLWCDKEMPKVCFEPAAEFAILASTYDDIGNSIVSIHSITNIRFKILALIFSPIPKVLLLAYIRLLFNLVA